MNGTRVSVRRSSKTKAIGVPRLIESINGQPARGDALAIFKELGFDIIEGSLHGILLVTLPSGWSITSGSDLTDTIFDAEGLEHVRLDLEKDVVHFVNITALASNAGYDGGNMHFPTFTTGEPKEQIQRKVQELSSGDWVGVSTQEQFDHVVEYLKKKNLTDKINIRFLKPT